MKLCLVYDNRDAKLQETAYSQCYRRMLARIADDPAWEKVQHVTQSCSAQDLDADVVLFYDIHSTHEIQIDGIRQHRAVKYTYLDDPHQQDFTGKDGNGRAIHKLGARHRIAREIKRGVRYILCPYRTSYYRFFAPYLGNEAERMLVWFPIAPDAAMYATGAARLKGRIGSLLGNGAVVDQHGAYEFRKWCFRQPWVYHVKSCLYDATTPAGAQYPEFLSRFAGALACFQDNAVPKYLEIPLAGCVTFAQWHQDYYDMGFRDFENCIYVDRVNFESRAKAFLQRPAAYQAIADAGRKLVTERFTADKFAAFLRRHAREYLNR